MYKKEVSSENGSILTKGAMEFMSIVGFGGGDRQFVNAVDKNLWEYVECKCDGGVGSCKGFIGIYITIYLFFPVTCEAKCTLDPQKSLNVKSIALRNSPRVPLYLQRMEMPHKNNKIK